MMFTTTQANELIHDTTSIWTSLNGVNGRKFTSNSNASKYIFLPACGYWFGSTHKYIDDCYYLSTSIYIYNINKNYESGIQNMTFYF